VDWTGEGNLALLIVKPRVILALLAALRAKVMGNYD
jgi:hypothetical protein